MRKSTVNAALSFGPAAPDALSATSIVEVAPAVFSTRTARHECLTCSNGQLTLALTTGYHVGPLFIVRKRRAPLIHGGTLGGKRRRRREAQATPKWLTPWQRAWIRALYKLADLTTKATSEQHVVDHIVPLDGKIVCGLHVPWNLRVIHWRANAVKGCGAWPDMPFEQMEIGL